MSCGTTDHEIIGVMVGLRRSNGRQYSQLSLFDELTAYEEYEILADQ